MVTHINPLSDCFRTKVGAVGLISNCSKQTRFYESFGRVSGEKLMSKCVSHDVPECKLNVWNCA